MCQHSTKNNVIEYIYCDSQMNFIQTFVKYTENHKLSLIYPNQID